MVNRAALQRLAGENLWEKVNSKIRGSGYPEQMLSLLFGFISGFFLEIPPELIYHNIRILALDHGHSDVEGTVITINDLRKKVDRTRPATIIVVDEFRCMVKHYGFSWYGKMIEYRYEGPLNEYIQAGDQKIRITQYMDSAASSIFTSPTFRELDEALDAYYEMMAQFSACSILNSVWQDGSNTALCRRPEHHMQKSLWQFLRSTLRSHSVLREQTVDARHPVDIKVAWPALKTVALIEIKWTGDSGNTRYRDSRANKGALQLINYLDASYRGEPDKYFKGYLVVFDARRDRRQDDYYRDKEYKYLKAYTDDERISYKRFYLESNKSACHTG